MISLSDKEIQKIKQEAQEQESKLSKNEHALRCSGHMYMNCSWSKHNWLDREVVFAEEFINVVTFQKLFYVKYFTQKSWWKQKTFDTREKALQFYERVKRRFITVKK
jgi:hypothetical protein